MSDTVKTETKTKTQKVFLRGQNLSREQARKIQRVINDRLAGKNVDVLSVFPAISGVNTGTAPVKTKVKTAVAAKPALKSKITVTYSDLGNGNREYYADGAYLATVRESRSNPGTFRYKTAGATVIQALPFSREVDFKTFKSANEAFLKLLRTYATFKTPTKAKFN